MSVKPSLKSSGKSSGPRNLDLKSLMFYNLPLQGIISILHRISGFVLFLALPLFLLLLDYSLQSPATFEAMHAVMGSFLVKVLAWGLLSAFFYHLVAGVKHLLMDAGVGETLRGAKMGGALVIGISVVISLLLGVCLW